MSSIHKAAGHKPKEMRNLAGQIKSFERYWVNFIQHPRAGRAIRGGPRKLHPQHSLKTLGDKFAALLFWSAINELHMSSIHKAAGHKPKEMRNLAGQIKSFERYWVNFILGKFHPASKTHQRGCAPAEPTAAASREDAESANSKHKSLLS